jgi:hypothetical protein
VWSWDITKLLGPAKWTYYYLYVIIDIYSRYVPGWLLAHRESPALAEQLLADTCFRQNIGHGQLSIHADRGSSMASKPVALLLADLGVTKSHSRPHVSNDNPFSEASSRRSSTGPTSPTGSTPSSTPAPTASDFFGWYNHQHRHSGIGADGPADVHYGRAEQITAARGRVLDAAYATNPERFVRKPPLPPSLADTVWINRPDPNTEGTTRSVVSQRSCLTKLDRMNRSAQPLGSRAPGIRGRVADSKPADRAGEVPEEVLPVHPVVPQRIPRATPASSVPHRQMATSRSAAGPKMTSREAVPAWGDVVHASVV